MKTRAEKDAANAQCKHRKVRSVVWQCLVAETREKLGLTLLQVAFGAGVSIAAVHNAESGAGVTLETARAIADYFGMTEKELWPTKVKP